MQDDNELMALVKQGNREAFNQLVMRHRLLAIAFAAGIVGNPQTAEDMVQEAFMKVYLYRDRYRPVYTFKTYLYHLIRNLCIDEIRRNRCRPQCPEEAAMELLAAEDTQESVLRRERLKQLNAGLAQLPADYKMAVYLYAVEQMSYEAIGAVMHKSLPQVKVTLHRARKKLKKWCDEEGICQ